MITAKELNHNLKLDSASADRLSSVLTNAFSPNDPNNKPFDDRVRDVILEYALPEWDVNSLTKYLDDQGYGCSYVPGMVNEAIDRLLAPHAVNRSWNKHFKSACDLVLKDLKRTGPRLLVRELNDLEDFEEVLPKKDAHSGWLFIENGVKLKGDNIEEVYINWQEFLTQARELGTFDRPILPGIRKQCSGGFSEVDGTNQTVKHKTRMVNMMDEYQIFAELMFSYPLQHFMHSKDWYAMGKRPETQHALVMKAHHSFKHWCSLDYSAYDQTLPYWLIRTAFDLVWKSCFAGDSHNQRWKWLWDIIVHDFIYKKLVTEDGTIIRISNGVPSGSMFTNLIDSICNLLIIRTYFCKIGVNERDYTMLVCGDDNLVFTRFYPIDRSELSSYIETMFGTICNPEKCEWGESRKDYPKFLSRTWRERGIWRHPKVLLAKILYPERNRIRAYKTGLDPALVVYSYILMYELGMRELIDVDHFIQMNSNLIKSFDRRAYANVMSGAFAYMYQYGILV